MSPRTRTQEMSEAEDWISASFKERIFVAMQSSEDLRALGILLEITFDWFVFCCVLTLILCFEDSFAVDWSIIVDNAIFQFRCSYQTTWIYFILMWMKRRIQKVKKFELLISTSTYELQLHNGYIFIFYLKIWQLYIALLLKIWYISDVIYELVVIRVIIYVTGRVLGLLNLSFSR